MPSSGSWQTEAMTRWELTITFAAGEPMRLEYLQQAADDPQRVEAMLRAMAGAARAAGGTPSLVKIAETRTTIV